jgi:hypothetical protein
MAEHGEQVASPARNAAVQPGRHQAGAGSAAASGSVAPEGSDAWAGTDIRSRSITTPRKRRVEQAPLHRGAAGPRKRIEPLLRHPPAVIAILRSALSVVTTRTMAVQSA